ncbi:hypothetical protein FB382_002654 [Nocardioides ginsengisegetis]|uniref:Secreted protein n=1 Tax=Nocardioides ginsengisegetis TaxID=661491 RepID=A0A7W3J141_9ACTN|nr:hypothetical protein [Nocardioides ginsengisegetis]MBA8804363.1 hypothetical protein [Nocardioides ginsengisegetis]
MKTAKLLGRGLLLSTTFISVFSGAAAWGLAQDGRISDSNNIDGASAQIDGESYNPSNPSCVVYSVIVASFDSRGLPRRQVETGLMRCNNATVDSGACTGGHAVAERYNGVGFVCVEGNTFNNGQSTQERSSEMEQPPRR